MNKLLSNEIDIKWHKSRPPYELHMNMAHIESTQMKIKETRGAESTRSSYIMGGE